jgi:hypothetical protein
MFFLLAFSLIDDWQTELDNLIQQLEELTPQLDDWIIYLQHLMRRLEDLISQLDNVRSAMESVERHPEKAVHEPRCVL